MSAVENLREKAYRDRSNKCKERQKKKFDLLLLSRMGHEGKTNKVYEDKWVAHGLHCLLATTFSSLRFLFNFTSFNLLRMDSVVFYFLIFVSYPQSSAFLYSVLPSLKLCLP